MPVLRYAKWSPCGNTTLFFSSDSCSREEQTRLAQDAQKNSALCAEQTGFLDLTQHHLRMAGDEFCLNAARAFGAHLARSHKKNEKSTFLITVSGWPSPISLLVEGSLPNFSVTATLTNFPHSHTPREEGIDEITLPAITHILINESLHPLERSHAKDILFSLLDRFHLRDHACVGVIWWQKNQDHFSITPLVYVKEVQTCFWEESCGSGSLALSLYLASLSQKKTSCSILQPSGESLRIAFSPQEGARVRGDVSLVSEGLFYWEPQKNSPQ